MLIIVFWNSEHFEITNISIGRIKKKKLYVYTMDYTFIDKSYKYNTEKETVAGNMQHDV